MSVTLQPRLDRLNSLMPDAAEAEFLNCCGSSRWARSMTYQRPFTSVEELLTKADTTWWLLDPLDWLKVFRSHPKIGEQKSTQGTTSQYQSWSEEEQSGIRNSRAHTLRELANLNERYEEKFGYIYIVCATGKSSEEMLAILRERLSNDPEDELRIAAQEQSRITHLRLKKLLGK